MFRLLLIVTVLASGCASTTTIMRESPGEVSTVLSAASAVSIKEAFALKSIPLGSQSIHLAVVPSDLPIVSLNNTKLVVVPVTTNGYQPLSMKVRSYIVRHGDGSHVLFYPIVSLVDDEYRVYGTVKPTYEFAFDEEKLLNEFHIPAGVRKLLVHTDPEYFRGTFAASTSGRHASEQAVAVGGVVGGVAGAVLVHGIAGPRSPKGFVFGEVGSLTISKEQRR